MEERQRVKIVDYVGSKKVEISKIDEKLKEAERGDPPRHVHRSRRWSARSKASSATCCARRASSSPTSRHEIKEMPGGPKLVHITFKMDEGPKVKIRKIDFVGNKAISDGTLKRQLKENKERGPFRTSSTSRPGSSRSSATTAPTRKRSSTRTPRRVVAYYRDNGYMRANVGVPELKVLERLRGQEDALDRAADSDHRRAALQGRHLRRRRQHRRQDRVPEAAVQDDAGRVLRREADPQGPREGARGLRRRRLLRVHRASRTTSSTTIPNPNEPEAPEALKAPEAPSSNRTARPIVDVTMRMQEGQQFFVNRITFVGNTTTRDNVIRREMRLVEDGVFNTEALKFSVKRLNQLGYFKALEGRQGRRRPEDAERDRTRSTSS